MPPILYFALQNIQIMLNLIMPNEFDKFYTYYVCIFISVKMQAHFANLVCAKYRIRLATI